MTSTSLHPAWSAQQYVRFEDERTRPVRDLLAALPNMEVRTAIDLGSGPGNSTRELVTRFPGAVVSGIDSSEDMIATARQRLPALTARLAPGGARAERAPLVAADRYYDLLRAARCKHIDIWRTTYHHPLAGGAAAIVEWIKGSVLLPFPRLFIVASV